MLAIVFAAGVIFALVAFFALRHVRLRLKPSWQLEEIPTPAQEDAERAPQGPFPVNAPAQAPVVPEAKKPKWPGAAGQYQIVRYRDDSFRVIEGRIAFQRLADIAPALAAERAAGHPGKLTRTIGTRMVEVTRWT